MDALCQSVMSDSFVSCLESDSMAHALLLMHEHELHWVAITEVTRRVIGILTDRDIAVRAMAENLPFTSPISVIMQREPFVTVAPDETLESARQKLREIGAPRALVTGRHGIVLGVIERAELSRRQQAVREQTRPATSGSGRIGRVS